MGQHDDPHESNQEHPSVSQRSLPDSEDEMLEDEIGGLFDELTQEDVP